MTKAVIIYSGGMDSFTLLNDLHNQGLELYPISFNYGQRHSKELIYAASVCKDLGLVHKVIDLSQIGEQILGGSSQTDPNIAVPHGHYADENMKLTVVPNRNMIMLSLAMGYAISIGANIVYYGAHSGDHAIYPDCRPDFVAAINQVGKYCHFTPIGVSAPYICLDKGDIAMIGRDLGLDYGKAWTCYEGKDKACGKCGACQERLEAMHKAGLVDPLEYV